MSEEMKPCPFCGHNQTWFTGDLCDGWVECGNCEARGPSSNLYMVDKKKAEPESRILWNNRKGSNDEE